MCTGLLLAGYLISKFQPKAWKLQVFDVVIGILWFIILVVFAFVGCNSKHIYGLESHESGENAMCVQILASYTFICTFSCLNESLFYRL